MKVLVTGASGFTGSYVVPRLLQRDVDVRCFVRKNSDLVHLPVKDVELVYGDLDDPTSLQSALSGIDALVNVASMGFGNVSGILSALAKTGVDRGVFVSTTAIFTSLNVKSKSVRLAAEQAIRESGLAYTIVRPTMIYGSVRDRNICRLVRFLNCSPILPIFGSGKYLQQPVFVDDVASAIVDSLLVQSTVNKAYNIAGREPLTYNQLVDTICALLRRKVLRVHLPASSTVLLLSTIEKIFTLPIKAEQIKRLSEDKVFDYIDAQNDFAFYPRPFEDGLKLELQEMNLI
jgi:uncharacterized protein YbjT (DUF2867 family)